MLCDIGNPQEFDEEFPLNAETLTGPAPGSLTIPANLCSAVPEFLLLEINSR